MNRKIYFIIFSAIILCTCLIILYISKPSSSIDDEILQNESLGPIMVNENILSNDDYIPDIYDGIVPKDSYITIANPELIYDLLTLDALSHIYEDTSSYLNSHGYADVHSLTILAESIIYEKTYPRFICKLDEKKDVYIEIRYNMEIQKFEFNISN